MVRFYYTGPVQEWPSDESDFSSEQILFLFKEPVAELGPENFLKKLKVIVDESK